MQLRQLRSALPRMLEPLTVKHSSRKCSGLAGMDRGSQLTTTPAQATFAAFMQSVNNTNKEVANFKDAYSGLAEGLFQRVRTSQSRQKSFRQWRATEHPDWADPPDRKRRRAV